jgi:hypothetical protein
MRKKSPSQTPLTIETTDSSHVIFDSPNKKATEFQWLGLERPGASQTQPQSTAFFGALAWVFLAAGSHTSLQADTLTTASRAQVHAGQCGQWLSEFTVCFGDDFVAHLRLQINNAKRY